jgi:hypothetical protein
MKPKNKVLQNWSTKIYKYVHFRTIQQEKCDLLNSPNEIAAKIKYSQIIQ